MNKEKKYKNNDIPSLLDNITKDLYEKAKYDIHQDDIENLYEENYKYDQECKECEQENEEYDQECIRYDNKKLDEQCIEKALCNILKLQKNILCYMQEIFCMFSKEIDNLESTEEEVILYEELICAYAQNECSTAKLVKALQKLDNINNYKSKCCYNSPFKKC